MDDIGSVISINVISTELQVGVGEDVLNPLEVSELYLFGEGSTKSHQSLSENDDVFFENSLRLTLGNVPKEIYEENDQAVGVLMFNLHRREETMTSRVYLPGTVFDRAKDLLATASGSITAVITTMIPFRNETGWQRHLIKGCELKCSFGREVMAHA